MRPQGRDGAGDVRALAEDQAGEVIVTCGGAISGYAPTPILLRLIIPNRTIRMAITHAKMGRSMKNLEKSMGIPWHLPGGAREQSMRM